jgi:hypothetical protein
MIFIKLNYVVLTIIMLTPLISHARDYYCNTSNLKPFKADNRYIFNSNATVIDKNTGLMWMQCPVGTTLELNHDLDTYQCTGEAVELNWEESLKTAREYEFVNYDNWRLPNIKELASLIDSSCTFQKNPRAFPEEILGTFWSSSPNRFDRINNPNNDLVWGVNFETGRLWESNISKASYIRLVRDISP